MAKEVRLQPSAIKIAKITSSPTRFQLTQLQGTQPCSTTQLAHHILDKLLHFLGRPIVVVEATHVSIDPRNSDDRATEEQPDYNTSF
jgi:hypothetical protein